MARPASESLFPREKGNASHPRFSNTARGPMDFARGAKIPILTMLYLLLDRLREIGRTELHRHQRGTACVSRLLQTNSPPDRNTGFGSARAGPGGNRGDRAAVSPSPDLLPLQSAASPPPTGAAGDSFHHPYAQSTTTCDRPCRAEGTCAPLMPSSA